MGERMRIRSDGAVILKPNGITTGLRLQGRSSDNNFFIQWNSNDGGTNYGSIGSVSATPGLQYASDDHKFVNQATNSSFVQMNASGTVFNEDSQDRDFRVESNDHEYKFFVDAQNNNIGIGTSSPDADVHIKQIGDIGNGNTQGLMLESGAGSQKYMLQTGRTGVSNAYFNLRDITNTRDIFSVIDTDGKFQGHTPFEWNNAAVFNEGSQDYDFRVESNGNTHMLFVDGGNNRVGIGAVPSAPFSVSAADGTLAVFTNASNADLAIKTASAVTLLTPSTGTLAFGTSNTERMRLDSTGSLVLQDGTTYTTNAPTHRGSLILAGASGATSFGGIEFHPNAGGGAGYGSKIGASDAEMTFSTRSNSTTFTQRMVIKGDGDLQWHQSPSSSASGIAFTNTVHPAIVVSGGNDQNFRHRMVFVNANGNVGIISTQGSATTYSTSSDYRLKENVVTDWDATTRLKQLKPSRFNFIADADTTVDGFLAHEVQAIVPEAITGTKDGMVDEEYEITPAVLDDDGNVTTEAKMGTRSVPYYQGIDQSKLVPLLVKTIQELEARITTLEE